MKTGTILATMATTLLLCAVKVESHGYLTIPVSRTRLAFEAGIEQCPECTILEPVNTWPDISGAPVGRAGPCGYSQRSAIDYNKPGKAWGNVVTTYKRGDVVDVQWCVDNNGDHGGMFSYRFCDDQELVNKFLDPNYTPTEQEKQKAEDCFQRGIANCNDVPGQSCEYSKDCSPGQPCYRNDWFTCGPFTHEGRCKSVDGHSPNGLDLDSHSHMKKRFLNEEEPLNPFCNNTGIRNDCGYVGITESECASRACCWDPVTKKDDNGPWCFYSNANGGSQLPPASCKTYTSHGFSVSSQIRIPNFVSNHTLVSLRWSSFQTPQVYLFCADVSII